MRLRLYRTLLIAAPSTLVAVGLGIWLLWPHSAISRANFDKLKVGMTLTEVEAILGGPARDEFTGHIAADVAQDNDVFADFVSQWSERDAVDRFHDLFPSPPLNVRYWKSDETVVLVILSVESRVASAYQLRVHRVRESLVDVFGRFGRWLDF